MDILPWCEERDLCLAQSGEHFESALELPSGWRVNDHIDSTASSTV